MKQTLRLLSTTRKTQVTRLLSTNPSTPESEQLSELRTQLVESRTQLDVAKEQLELVRQQAEQYRAISDSMEEELKKSGEASQLFKQQNQQQLLQMTNERNSLKTNLEQAEEKLKVFIIILEVFLLVVLKAKSNSLVIVDRNWRRALFDWVKPVLTSRRKF